VDYIKVSKPMDDYSSLKVLAGQIWPHLDGNVMLVDTDNLTAVQKHTHP